MRGPGWDESVVGDALAEVMFREGALSGSNGDGARWKAAEAKAQELGAFELFKGLPVFGAGFAVRMKREEQPHGRYALRTVVDGGIAESGVVVQGLKRRLQVKRLMGSHKTPQLRFRDHHQKWKEQAIALLGSRDLHKATGELSTGFDKKNARRDGEPGEVVGKELVGKIGHGGSGSTLAGNEFRNTLEKLPTHRAIVGEDARRARRIEPVLRELMVKSVRVTGRAPRISGPNWRMVGQDGGLSIPLGEDSLFVFADTLIATGNDSGEVDIVALLRQRQGIFLGNCAGIARGATGLSEAMGKIEYFADPQGRPRELLEMTTVERLSGYRLWPQHGVRIGDAVYLFYLAIQQTTQGDLWGFENLGTGLAVFDLASERCHRVMHREDWRLWPELPASCHVGVQIVREGGWLYVFGSRKEGLEFRAFVARVPEDGIAEVAAYEFFCGSFWSRDWRTSRTLGECGRDFSVSWNAHLRGYLMTYLDPYTHELLMRSGPRPWGPFGPALRAGRVPSDERTELVSLGFEHPQYSGEGGRELAISYSQPRFLQNTLVAVALGDGALTPPIQ